MKSEQVDSDMLFKIVLVGDSGVGKTNIMVRYTRSQFLVQSKTTIGVQFSSKVIDCKGKRVKIQVWDTAGQERYRSIVSSYYRGASGSILVYDISRQSSFESVEKWLKEVKNYTNDGMVTMLVGNKSDLKHLRSVRTQTAEQFAKTKGLLFLETSALDATNVQEAFVTIVQKIIEKQSKAVAVSPTIQQSLPKTTLKKEQSVGEGKKKKKCC